MSRIRSFLTSVPVHIPAPCTITCDNLLSANETRENTLRGFSLVIAAVARVSHKRRLWFVVRVNKNPSEAFFDDSGGFFH